MDAMQAEAAALGVPDLGAATADQLRALAASLDDADGLAGLRAEFVFPPAPAPSPPGSALYLCGNSLGLQPRALRAGVEAHLDKWGEQAVEGHFTDPTPWLTVDNTVRESMAVVVGALPHEVAVMNSLTVNLHLMMAAFYRPTAARHKIVIEADAFPSDAHAVASQVEHCGFSPAASVVKLSPREGEATLRDEDVVEYLEREGAEVALVLLGGLQYLTGQLFDMPAITAAARACGARVGWDLAHAVGNVPLRLHEWGPDFAVWCCYKYLNAGPGTIGGCFVHESSAAVPRLSGWWGHRVEDRFVMAHDFVPEPGAYGFRLSNPPPLLVACVRASLDLFERAGGMAPLRAKSLRLTGLLEALLLARLPDLVEVTSPRDPHRRGCQLSLRLLGGADVERAAAGLKARGVVCDTRKPDVMRVAPAPLYNSFADVCSFVLILGEVLQDGCGAAEGSAAA